MESRFEEGEEEEDVEAAPAPPVARVAPPPSRVSAPASARVCHAGGLQAPPRTAAVSS